MRMSIFFTLIFTWVTVKSYGQHAFPKLDTNSLVSKQFDLNEISKPYTVIVYGGVGCGYSQHLIKNLNVLDECKSKCDIILIMDQTKEIITMNMQKTLDQYPIFSNSQLQYKLKKKNDVFPQVLLFRNQLPVEHIVGIKEGMLTKLKERILLDR